MGDGARGLRLARLAAPAVLSVTMPEPGSPDFSDYPDWSTGRAEALGPGHGQVARVVVRDGLVGTGRVGALAFGALALGAFAIGALAIGRLVVGRLKLGRGEIRSLKIADLEVGTLRVGCVTRSDASET